MYQRNDRLDGTFRLQRYKKYRIYANKINKKNTHKNNIIDTRTSTLPHYHIKKCVEWLQISKKCSNFAAKFGE